MLTNEVVRTIGIDVHSRYGTFPVSSTELFPYYKRYHNQGNQLQEEEEASTERASLTSVNQSFSGTLNVILSLVSTVLGKTDWASLRRIFSSLSL